LCAVGASDTTGASFEPAWADDLPTILDLLRRNELPQEGLSKHIQTTLVARRGKRVVGSAALELYGRSALLRSVAVEKSLRGRGIGSKLTEAALNLARERGVLTVYLLTETAMDFFRRFGFKLASRSRVPLAVKQSVEFAHACPASARVMILRL